MEFKEQFMKLLSLDEIWKIKYKRFGHNWKKVCILTDSPVIGV